jgi:putative transposase
MTQACGIVKGIANSIKKLQDKLEYLKEKGYSTKNTEELLEKKLNAKEPELKNVKAELSSKCAEFLDKDDSFFNGFLKLSSLGICESFFMPIKFSKHTENLMKKGFERMNSFLISSDKIEIRWKKTVERKENGKIVGCDTGIKDIATFSEDDVLSSDSGYDRILNKIARKRRNSKNYKNALIERDNYIRFILNGCNLSEIKQLNIENNSSLKYGKRSSKKLGSHAYGIIKEKLERICEEQGVLVKFTPSTYRSQRCSACGWTQKSNRKAKIFSCKSCHYHSDSDRNSSRNQLVILPYIASNVRELSLNRKGFFWNPSGLYDKAGRSLESLVQDYKEKPF